MARMTRAPLAWLALSAILAAPTFAFAGGNEAAAEALFDEAKKLASQGNYAEACPKFAESNRLDRGAGTLIHLGDCYEKNKQSASAWATYKEAASAAQALGRKDWEKLAAQRASALEPKLAHLTIKVDPANGKVDISRDGAPLSQASYAVPIPVDVGEHSVEATAAGYKPFTATVKVSRDGELVEVTVPKLEIATPASAAPPPVAPISAATSEAPAPLPKTSSRRTIGFVVGGVGVAGIAVGAVTGLMAMGKSSDAKRTCSNDGPCANREAVDASDSAKTFGLVSTVAFIAGGVGLAAGAALVLTAPKQEEASRSTARIRVAPSAGPGGGGLTVVGVF
jgi:hypothetical protein